MNPITHTAFLKTLPLHLFVSVLYQKVWKEWWLEDVCWERVFDKPHSYEVELTFSAVPLVVANSAGETLDMHIKASAAERLEMIRLGMLPKEFVGGGA